MRTNGSSTETSLGREKGCMKRTATTIPRSHRQPRDQAFPVYSPASRHHQLHLDPVGYQDSQNLLVGSLFHTAIGRRGAGSGIQGSHSISCAVIAMRAHGIPLCRTLLGPHLCQAPGCFDLQHLVCRSSHPLLFLWSLLTMWACVAV